LFLDFFSKYRINQLTATCFGAIIYTNKREIVKVPMNIFKLTVLCAALVLSGVADAKGGSSSSSGGGRSSGGMSSGRSPSYSSTSRANSAPSVAPTNRPNSAPSIAPNSPNAPRPNSAPVIAPNAPRPATTTPRTTSTTTTTTSSSYSRNVNYGGGMAYGGMGMGYGYSNGILTGLLIGSMLHPHNTVVYAGGGSYNNNALLYPDGRGTKLVHIKTDNLLMYRMAQWLRRMLQLMHTLQVNHSKL